MGGRRLLAGGYRVWLPDHRSQDGVMFRRYLRAAQEIVGPPGTSQLLRIEIQRYATAAVVRDQAARRWAEAVERREHGKGRRPSERQVERAARRLGLCEVTLSNVTARLEELAATRRGASPVEALRKRMQVAQ